MAHDGWKVCALKCNLFIYGLFFDLGFEKKKNLPLTTGPSLKYYTYIILNIMYYV